MEINFTSQQKRRKFFLELKDLVLGAVYPFVLMCVLSVSIIALALTDDVVLNVIGVCVGEVFLFVAYVIFGRQSGITAYKRTVSGERKRNLAVEDITVYYKTGEYAPYKGFLIGAISTLPYLIFQMLYFIAPLDFFSFLLEYAFAWAVMPFSFIENAPAALNLLSVVPSIAIQGAAYIIGKKTEEKRIMNAPFEDNKSRDKKAR